MIQKKLSNVDHNLSNHWEIIAKVPNEHVLYGRQTDFSLDFQESPVKWEVYYPCFVGREGK